MSMAVAARVAPFSIKMAPLLVVATDKEVQKTVEWLKVSCPDDCTLSIAGTREFKKPGIQKATLVWVLEILGKANGKCYWSLLEHPGNMAGASAQH